MISMAKIMVIVMCIVSDSGDASYNNGVDGLVFDLAFTFFFT